jgi:hypothetical protein
MREEYHLLGNRVRDGISRIQAHQKACERYRSKTQDKKPSSSLPLGDTEYLTRHGGAHNAGQPQCR